jgi:hypothetical protein
LTNTARYDIIKPSNEREELTMDKELYQLNIDEVMANLSLFTDYDIGGVGHGIVVERKNLDDAIDEIVSNFQSLIEDSFEPYEEEEEE